jgi:hypothetical protein
MSPRQLRARHFAKEPLQQAVYLTPSCVQFAERSPRYQCHDKPPVGVELSIISAFQPSNQFTLTRT